MKELIELLEHFYFSELSNESVTPVGETNAGILVTDAVSGGWLVFASSVTMFTDASFIPVTVNKTLFGRWISKGTWEMVFVCSRFVDENINRHG